MDKDAMTGYYTELQPEGFQEIEPSQENPFGGGETCGMEYGEEYGDGPEGFSDIYGERDMGGESEMAGEAYAPQDSDCMTGDQEMAGEGTPPVAQAGQYGYAETPQAGLAGYAETGMAQTGQTECIEVEPEYAGQPAYGESAGRPARRTYPTESAQEVQAVHPTAEPAQTPQAAQLLQEKQEKAAEAAREEKERAEHEAAEARRKADWEAVRQAKKAAEKAQMDKLAGMGDEEAVAAAMVLRSIFYDLQFPWLIVADLPDIMT